MEQKKTTFAVFFGNRGVFPGSLMKSAREEVPRILKELGHDVLVLDEEATRLGAIETPKEGKIYADFLHANKGKFGGVIISLPNFGDENGALAAFADIDVPILVQAYPDEFDKMGPAVRRDSFCGKCSITDVLYQAGIKATVLKPHTVHPTSERFKQNIDTFDRICKVYNGVRKMRIGSVGARVTAFKTVRVDEVALQRHGITVETFDLSQIFDSAINVDKDSSEYKNKMAHLDECASWGDTPNPAKEKLARLGVALDRVIISPSWNEPVFDAPSPKKHTATWPVFCICWASAAPAATVTPLPTIEPQ